MNKFFALTLLVPVLLGGCGKKKEKRVKNNKEVDMPLASNNTKGGFFDEEAEAFVLEDEFKKGNQAVAKNDQAVSWVAETNTKGFQPIYFDFDRYSVRADQEGLVAKDAAEAKKIVAKGEKVVVEGHACHSAGSKAYNLLISEQRAQEVARRLESEGVSQDKVTVVGRGTEMSVVLGGDRNAQAANRRVEMFPLAS